MADVSNFNINGAGYAIKDATARENLANEIAARNTAVTNEANARISAVSAEESARATAVNSLQSQINSFTALAAGSTTGDAELTNARVSYDGITYSTAGDAIRNQASELDIRMDGIYSSRSFRLVNYTLTLAGVWSNGGSALLIPISGGERITVKGNATNPLTWYTFSTDPHVVLGSSIVFASGYSSLIRFATIYSPLTAPAGATYLVIIGGTGGKDYTPADIQIEGRSVFSSVMRNLYDRYLHSGPQFAAVDDFRVYGTGYKNLKAVPIGTVTCYTYNILSELVSNDAPWDEGFTLVTLGNARVDTDDMAIGGRTQYAFNLRTGEMASRTLYDSTNGKWNNWNYAGQTYYFVGPTRTSGTINEYTTLKGCLGYITGRNIKNATVFVDPGTYDLVTEFGQSYLDSISQSTNKGIGLFIGNGTHIIFSEGAYVTFNYNGTNTAVCEYFSPFNVYGDFTLENANIEVKNCRYCVHEDLPTSIGTGTIPNSYTGKYINCHMKHNGNTSGSYTGTVCIGGGCMPNSLSIVDGGTYECGTSYPRAISYHNFSKSTYGDHPARVIIKNVWVNNAIRLGTFSDSTVYAEISGCHIPNGIYDANTTYFTVKSWNNAT